MAGKIFDEAEVDEALARAAALSNAKRIVVTDLLATLRERRHVVV